MPKYEVTIRFEAANASEAMTVAEDAFRYGETRVDYEIAEVKVSR